MFGQGTVIIGTWTQKARSRVFSGISTAYKNNSWFSALFGKHGQDWGRNSTDNPSLSGHVLPALHQWWPCLFFTRWFDAFVAQGRMCQTYE